MAVDESQSGAGRDEREERRLERPPARHLASTCERFTIACVEICPPHATKLNVASIAATALTGSGALGLFASDDFVLKLATALLAFVSLLYMLTMAFDFPGEVGCQPQTCRKESSPCESRGQGPAFRAEGRARFFRIRKGLL